MRQSLSLNYLELYSQESWTGTFANMDYGAKKGIDLITSQWNIPKVRLRDMTKGAGNSPVGIVF